MKTTNEQNAAKKAKTDKGSLEATAKTFVKAGANLNATTTASGTAGAPMVNQFRGSKSANAPAPKAPTPKIEILDDETILPDGEICINGSHAGLTGY